MASVQFSFVSNSISHLSVFYRAMERNEREKKGELKESKK